MEDRLQWVAGHVEVYDRMGTFLFSADTEHEALEDLALMEQKEAA